MALIGFIVVALWVLPMLLSMSADSDHVSTLCGVVFSNAVALGGIYALMGVHGLPHSPWWLLLAVPVVLGSYFGIWFGYSDNFNRLVRDLLRIR
jgi:uncharacterized membrane protein YfcA